MSMAELDAVVLAADQNKGLAAMSATRLKNLERHSSSILTGRGGAKVQTRTGTGTVTGDGWSRGLINHRKTRNTMSMQQGKKYFDCLV